jgi:Fe-S-cluster containining protein
MTDQTPGENDCPEACRAICCRYIVKKIEPPRTRLDWDELYWFLCHDKVSVYIEERKWYLLVNVPCMHLTRNSRCRVYPNRPDVCRMHEAENCEYTGELDFQVFMERPEDLIRLMEKRKISYRLPWLPQENRAGKKKKARASGSRKQEKRFAGDK